MQRTNVREFAKTLSEISFTDRWAFIAVTGDMGDGKSCFLTQCLKEVAKFNKLAFSYKHNLTYSRKELKVWIDGDKEGKNQKDERTSIIADELISMFFKRNWYDSAQIDGIELLNKCRDRHLVVGGAIPSFFDLDGAIYSILSFWVHIYERGRAWVFQKDRNPFIADKWHISENAKIWRKDKNPYRCPNFVCEVIFDDWDPKDKEEYYLVRNEKRKNTEGQREKEERYGVIKDQRDKLIRLTFNLKPEYTNKDIADIIDLSPEAVRLIKEGLR